MGVHVSSKVAPVCEGFSTVGTTERLLTGVGPHVALQKPRPREVLSANFAFVVGRVSQQMHAENQGYHEIIS